MASIYFSILLTTKNSGEYVKQCVASILAQTYKNFNLLVFDDNSTDGTLEWLQSIESDQIIIFPSNENLGIEKNWGRFTEVDKYEYCTIIGHDDLLYPNFLETIVQNIQATPSAMVYHTYFNFINKDDVTIRQCKPIDSSINFLQFIQLLFNGSIDITGTGYVMHTSIFNKIGGMPTFPKLLFADYALLIRLLSYKEINNSIGEKHDQIMATTAKVQFAFRLHQSVTTRSDNTELYNAFSMLLNDIKKIAEDNVPLAQIIKANGQIFLLNNITFFCHRLLRTPKEIRTDSVANIIERSKKLAADFGLNDFRPEKKIAIRLAKLIDNSKILSYMFLRYRNLKQ